MRVLVAHNRYRAELPSGENRAVDLEIEALRTAGAHVIPYLRSSDEIETMSRPQKLRAAASPLYSARAVRDVTDLIRSETPDVLHLHNPYPLISWGVVEAAHRRGVAVVQTVHNHRHTCMSGSYLRDGHPCHDCVGKGPWPGVVHHCYRGSRAQSVMMAGALLSGRRAYTRIDRFLAVTPQTAASLQAAGVAPDRIVVKPNSAPDPGPQPVSGSGTLFVGRLTVEKGAPLLVEAWLRHPEGRLGELTVAGDGEERDRLAQRVGARRDIVLLGPVSPDRVSELMGHSGVVVLPSTAEEALPLTLLEALAHGRAVAVSAVGGLPDVVGNELGWVIPATVDAWSAALPEIIAADLSARGKAARATYERSYLPGVVTARLLEVYAQAIAARRRADGRSAAAPPLGG